MNQNHPILIDRKRLREIVPLCDKTIYNLEQRGQFPRRIALSPRRVAWVLQEVEAWLADRRDAKAAPPAAFVR